MENSSSVVSLKGLYAIAGSVAFYWLSNRSGRDATTLAATRRLQKLGEISSIMEDLNNYETIIVAVNGRVTTNQPVISENSYVKGVILEQTTEHIFLRNHLDSGHWVQDSRIALSSIREAPWFLEDESGRVSVLGARGARGLVLPVVSITIEEESSSSVIRGALEFMQGHKFLGVKRTERILPVGTQLTVVGEAIKDDEGGITLRAPQTGPFFVSSKPLDMLVLHLGKLSRICRWLSVGCSVVGLFWLAKHSIEQILERRRTKSIRERVLSAAAEIAERNRESENGADPERRMPDLCIICLERRYNVVFLRCGHMCTCLECSSRLTDCPLCRRRIAQVVRAYRP